MQKIKIKFNKIKPKTNSAKILSSIGKFGDLSKVYIKNRKTLLSEILRLKKNKLIESASVNKTEKFLLTKDGLIEFLKLELAQTDIFNDGKECMVIFDVPEISRTLRIALTFFLEDACFIRFQKSVWISKFDASERLAEIFFLTGIDKWVKVFTVEETVWRQKIDDRRFSVAKFK